MNLNFEMNSLPFEIASLISKYLDHSSLANCCLVNKHWYACFISSVWESPKVNGLDHLKSLHHSLDSIASIMEKNNDNKHLDLTSLIDEYDYNEGENDITSFDYADSQIQSLFSELANYCSELKSLTLKVPSEKNSSKDAPNFFFALRQFAKSALSLESLTLDFNDMTVFYDHFQESIPLECFTKIHTLNLQNAAMVDDSAFIWLWSNCPLLTSITISQSSSLADYVLNPLLRINGDKIKTFNLERCSRLSPNSLLNIIINCKNLERLRWVNNGASFNRRLLSNYSYDFEIKDMDQFMTTLNNTCVVTHLKELDYAFLNLSKASVIFDFLIEKNRESLESIKCDTSEALVDAVQKNLIFPQLKEVSCTNKAVSLKELSKSVSSSLENGCHNVITTNDIIKKNVMSLEV
jgi:hypothetical protein